MHQLSIISLYSALRGSTPLPLNTPPEIRQIVQRSRFAIRGMHGSQRGFKLTRWAFDWNGNETLAAEVYVHAETKWAEINTDLAEYTVTRLLYGPNQVIIGAGRIIVPLVTDFVRVFVQNSAHPARVPAHDVAWLSEHTDFVTAWCSHWVQRKEHWRLSALLRARTRTLIS